MPSMNSIWNLQTLICIAESWVMMMTNESIHASIRGSVHGEELKMAMTGNDAGLKVILTQAIYQMAKQGMSIDDMARAMKLGITMASHDAIKEELKK